MVELLAIPKDNRTSVYHLHTDRQTLNSTFILRTWWSRWSSKSVDGSVEFSFGMPCVDTFHTRSNTSWIVVKASNEVNCIINEWIREWCEWRSTANVYVFICAGASGETSANVVCFDRLYSSPSTRRSIATSAMLDRKTDPREQRRESDIDLKGWYLRGVEERKEERTQLEKII